jgi:hypothetical protein
MIIIKKDRNKNTPPPRLERDEAFGLNGYSIKNRQTSLLKKNIL